MPFDFRDQKLTIYVTDEAGNFVVAIYEFSSNVPIEYRDLQPLARGFQSLLFTRGVVIGVQPYFPTATVNIDPQTDFSKGNLLIETNDNASRHVLASRWAYNILREILPNAKT